MTTYNHPNPKELKRAVEHLDAIDESAVPPAEYHEIQQARDELMAYLLPGGESDE